MKTMKVTCLCVALLALGVVSGFAQSPVRAEAELTCAFNVEDTTLPAGKYNVRQISAEQFALDSPALNVAVVFLTEPGAAVKEGSLKYDELVFKIYGGRYFLSAVRLMESPNEHQLIPHSTEKEWMKKGASKTEVVRCKMAPGPK